ncbi:phosphatidylserine/phosphatidylglycerophosphate/cardiolipin synthase family protein [Streptomyces cinnamoneus]|uniref:phospholipase D-like domain-containing protein n=1 Tax=Streptomyces cinnamoneus TaxID=53446 RepID=UPI00342635C1
MKRRRSKKVSRLAISALSVAAISLSATPATGVTSPGSSAAAATVIPVSPSEVHNYTWFNKKFDPDPHAEVVAHVIRLINAAPRGAKLSLTLYYFDRKAIVEALRHATDREVEVRLVVDGYMVGNYFHDALKAIPKVKLVECDPTPSGGKADRGCMSNRIGSSPLDKPPVMHNKFMTIDKVKLAGGGTAKNVLYVASANLDTAFHAYESALTISHERLYEHYVKYFNDLMYYGSHPKEVNNNYGKTSKVGKHRVYTFPRKEAGNRPRSASNDPIADILRRTTCAPSGKTRIDVANFRIQRQAVVNELIAARTRGCQVRIVTGDGSLSGAKTLARAMPVHLCAETEAGGRPVHEKFMIVRQGAQSMLYAGSHNLTYRALRQNDENILGLRNHPVAGPYQQRFEYLHGECKPWKPTSNVAPPANADDEGDAD